MVNKESSLSIAKQRSLLLLNRQTLYHKARDSHDDANLMNEIHELWLKFPFYGQRRITACLNRSGYLVNRKRVQRLMRLLNLEAIYPKRTTIACRKHEKYPYLLGDLDVTHPNHVWATDITYIKMRKGFVYLVALIDLFSRHIVSWQLSTCMEIDFCMEMLEGALSKGAPKIINTDQGSQFTSGPWIEALLKNKVAVSMDSKGRYLDNIYAERFWRSLKQEEVYLNPYDSVGEARERIGKYIEFYNHQRPHQSLGYRTPAEVYFAEKVDRALVLPGKNAHQCNAVDIMDNLQASYPQYPQAHQQQIF